MTTVFPALLEHARRQFIQDCLFLFNKAVFLATPEFIALLSTTPCVVLDSNGDPHAMTSPEVKLLKAQATDTLWVATDKFLTRKAEADKLFEERLISSVLPEEEIE